jgi:hypothetical protein
MMRMLLCSIGIHKGRWHNEGSTEVWEKWVRRCKRCGVVKIEEWSKKEDEKSVCSFCGGSGDGEKEHRFSGRYDYGGDKGEWYEITYLCSHCHGGWVPIKGGWRVQRSTELKV